MSGTPVEVPQPNTVRKLRVRLFSFMVDTPNHPQVPKNIRYMKALVTGASGFIGSTLIEELGTLGFDVRALMRKSSPQGNLEGLRYERVEGSLDDLESLKRAVKDVDYIFHLAG